MADEKLQTAMEAVRGVNSAIDDAVNKAVAAGMSRETATGIVRAWADHEDSLLHFAAIEAAPAAKAGTLPSTAPFRGSAGLVERLNAGARKEGASDVGGPSAALGADNGRGLLIDQGSSGDAAAE